MLVSVKKFLTLYRGREQMKLVIMDCDDTALDTRIVYGGARKVIFKVFDDLGLSIYAWSEPFSNTNECIGLMPMYKQLNKSAKASGNTDLTLFPNVCVTMYKTLLHRKKGVVGPVMDGLSDKEQEIANSIYNAAHSVYETAPPLVDGALDFLTFLRNEGWTILMYTLGDATVQHNRIYVQTQLHKYVDYVKIVDKKDTATLRNLINYEVGFFFLGGPRPQTIYIGDAPQDAEPALELQIPAYIRRTEYYTEKDFADAHKITFFNRFGELKAGLLNNPVEYITGLLTLC